MAAQLKRLLRKNACGIIPASEKQAEKCRIREAAWRAGKIIGQRKCCNSDRFAEKRIRPMRVKIIKKLNEKRRQRARASFASSDKGVFSFFVRCTCWGSNSPIPHVLQQQLRCLLKASTALIQSKGADMGKKHAAPRSNQGDLHLCAGQEQKRPEGKTSLRVIDTHNTS